MIIRLMSDIHLEFGPLTVPMLPNESEQILILAGDIGIANKTSTYVEFFEEMSERFCDVIHVLGNHEHYHGNFPTSATKMSEALHHLTNVTLLDDSSIVIGDTAFIGATLWTNMDNGNPVTMYAAEYGMNDYKIIRSGPQHEPWKRKFKPIDAIATHKNSVEYIFAEVKKHSDNNLKTVVITHHSPSTQSVSESYCGDGLTGAYCSDLSNNILDNPPTLIVHGHVHRSFDYPIGTTRIVCNPRGYVGHDTNVDFDPELTITI